MATLTISLAGSSVINGNKAYTISDPDVQKLIDSMIIKYSPTPPAPPLTPAQALLAWVQNQLINATVAEVKNIETHDAIVKMPEVSPIVFT